jgi:hypothetical protein
MRITKGFLPLEERKAFLSACLCGIILMLSAVACDWDWLRSAASRARRALEAQGYQSQNFQVAVVAGSSQAIPSTSRISVTSYTYAAEDSNYDLNWPGPPRREWQEGDKEYYLATVVLSNPATEDFSLGFWIKHNKKFWFDPTLGFFMVKFTGGSNTGTGRFWLVCTKKGKVKGSEGKDSKHAKVYLEAFSFASEVDERNWAWEGVAHGVHRPENKCNCR